MLNQDLLFARGWLEPLIAFLENTPKAAGAQPRLLLEDGERVNTSGNRNHFLGFCFMTDYQRPLLELETSPREIDSLSGAAFVVRTSALGDEPLFNADYFMYLEDTELSWRLRQRGFGVWLVPGATVRHRYRFQAPYRFYYRLERNRLALLLTYYRKSTLCLIAPAWALMELGQWFFAWNNGLLAERARVYREICGRTRRRQIAQWRRDARRKRVLTDRTFAGGFSGTIDFAPLRGALVRFVANPILGTYWACVRRLLW